MSGVEIAVPIALFCAKLFAQLNISLLNTNNDAEAFVMLESNVIDDIYDAYLFHGKLMRCVGKEELLKRRAMAAIRKTEKACKEPYSSHMNCDAPTAAWIMRSSVHFQQAKHQFGTNEAQKGIPVPHLKDPESSLGDRIQDGMLIGIQNDLEDFFNKQLDKIQERIRDLMSNWHTGGRLHYLLLSGGLGSSAYVQKKLRDFCARHDDLKNTHVIVSHCPRMAVSMGLVYDAMSNRTLLAEICCRTSFGLVFRMPNDKSLVSRLRSKFRGFKPWGFHRSRDTLVSGVDWFIKQGDGGVNGREATHPYNASFKTNAPRVCDVEIVASPDKSLSPSEKDHPQSRVLIHVDLEHSDPLEEFTTWRQESYLTFPFFVKATIEPAEVKFRCVDSKGKEVGEGVSFFADGGHTMRPLLMGLREDEE
ncbi:hypothetical protein NCS57_00361200 [Fusarium keratoplasticum]|uniref:Uncharacterized protein n=1 Tax=Fusarium keratoplasticum TaxID=1328300 RepID=A0ACC0R6B9_9HYPO|nr:hypothetical protein NCS57_00361200 [Fusarium keratoplasticum]KAI8674625.1 hypothetical protein NCS57_00361200 [Fusarium keratoplasticum]